MYLYPVSKQFDSWIVSQTTVQKYNNIMRRGIYLAFLFSTSMVCAAQAQPAQTNYEARDLHISFLSHTPLKEIKAYSTQGTSTFNTGKQEIAFSVDISSFVFFRLLMQEHFNRKYMESNRFPRATFKGRFIGDIDWSRQGKQAVRVQGTLDIHGKKNKREIDGFLTIQGEEIMLESTFEVNTDDHGIVIPPSVSDRISRTIEVKVRGEYAPYDQFVKK